MALDALDSRLRGNDDSSGCMERSIIYGLSALFHGKISIKGGKVEQANFDQYPVLRMNETPKVEVHIVASKLKPQAVWAKPACRRWHRRW